MKVLSVFRYGLFFHKIVILFHASSIRVSIWAFLHEIVMHYSLCYTDCYFLIGVCRIVIFAESEYSAEYTLPNPNILPNIRHCRIMKKICLIKRVFNADVHSSE